MAEQNLTLIEGSWMYLQWASLLWQHLGVIETDLTSRLVFILDSKTGKTMCE